MIVPRTVCFAFVLLVSIKYLFNYFYINDLLLFNTLLVYLNLIYSRSIWYPWAVLHWFPRLLSHLLFSCLYRCLVLVLSAPAFAVWSLCVSRWQICFQGYGGCSRCCQSMAAFLFLLATTGRTNGSCLTRTPTPSRPSRNMNRKACTPQRHCEVVIWKALIQ